MSFYTSLKTPFALLTHIIAYVVFILSIVQICKHKDMYGQRVDNYVPAIVAILVMSTLQTLYHVGYWLCAKRTSYSIAKVLIALAFFACFNFGAVVALTVQRHDFCNQPLPEGHYVTGAAYTFMDCQGTIRGMMGMTWALFGMDLFYIIYLGVLTRYADNGAATPVGLVGEVNKVAEDEEKAPVH
ncbi:hypothetical protein CC85DRAFT_292613 [Cutaneotrichosporon oleaginosum]|uniref:MARVEL domain-containing protein n=1 Tax=Cutaneotrichosporon oleaginosum TaxID=879819 RepID=A0A0J0XK86_9TREE|nr:uncharacterized protein CC85DRAFT_292613 [Cutaneotrichosporon oleaginosum]KLT41482.1 hypothetical protein CC85DRAFT_292613 [Cutaneotrichosporon oleaginosum]